MRGFVRQLPQSSCPRGALKFRDAAFCGNTALDFRGKALLKLRRASLEGSAKPGLPSGERVLRSRESSGSVFVNAGDVSLGVCADALDRRPESSQLGAKRGCELGA
jgi:hypothetical protein